MPIVNHWYISLTSHKFSCYQLLPSNNYTLKTTPCILYYFVVLSLNIPQDQNSTDALNKSHGTLSVSEIVVIAGIKQLTTNSKQELTDSAEWTFTMADKMYSIVLLWLAVSFRVLYGPVLQINSLVKNYLGNFTVNWLEVKSRPLNTITMQQLHQVFFPVFNYSIILIGGLC